MTGQWDQTQIDIIDQRIAKALAAIPQPRPATLASRDSTGTGGTATFFGSGLSVPVKIPATVAAFPGDAVGLIRFGPSDWTVVYAFPRWGTSEAGVNDSTGSDTTSSSSFTDMAGIATFTWRKRYDDTRAALWMSAGVFSSSAPGQGVIGMQLDDGTTATDVPLFIIRAGTTNIHVWNSGDDTVDSLPAGLYTVTARWRATTAPLNFNNVDTVSMRVRETGPLHP